MKDKRKDKLKFVKVRWTCGHYVGESVWHGTEVYEPNDCNMEFETEEEIWDWENESCVVKCPSCGAELTQDMDRPELIMKF